MYRASDGGQGGHGRAPRVWIPSSCRQRVSNCAIVRSIFVGCSSSSLAPSPIVPFLSSVADATQWKYVLQSLLRSARTEPASNKLTATMQKGEAALEDLRRELVTLNAPYSVDRFLSSGSYGAVCGGTFLPTKTPVAVKRVYTTVSDGKVVNILGDTFLARRVVREVKLLSHFVHPNILGLRDLAVSIVPDHGGTGGKHKMYLFTELMRTDLAQVIQDKRIQLTKEHIQFFLYHMLLGLHALHSAGVVHRDLHPGNILLSEENDVKICDFNLAREDKADDDKTHYVTHRWYRAPELVMQYRHFTKVVDIWSAGCVMGELYNRKALFRGSTFYNQLNKIIEILGTPADEEFRAFASESARTYLKNTLDNIPATPWAQVCPAADPVALDLLSKMLAFNPAKRIPVDQALRHPYFADIFDERDLTEDLSSPFHFNDSIDDVSYLHGLIIEEASRFETLRAQAVAAAATPPAVAVSPEGGGASASAGDDDPDAPVGEKPSGVGGLTAHHVPRTASSVSLADLA